MRKPVLSVLVAVLATPFAFSDDCCETTASTVEQRFREIDLGIMLKQYEQIQTEVAKMRFQVILIQTEPKVDEGQVESLRRRIELLAQRAVDLKDQALALAKSESVAAK